METEGSLPPSQMPAICPYPEPDQSIPYPHIPLPGSILILSSHLYLGTELHVQTVFIRSDKYELSKALFYIQKHDH
jgi:hypothetical protein